MLLTVVTLTREYQVEKFFIWYLWYQMVKILIAAPFNWNPAFRWLIGPVLNFIPEWFLSPARVLQIYTLVWMATILFAIWLFLFKV
ncbi:hypothetical protein COB52_06025 [Candidatus Kaiserbacteria bacterium]|nr:MAG: hypothetical protein COB52_06025 [Candidatus Kaiserbacteria bacterium]